ncbi:MAG: hypothetical protein ACTJLK_03995 [Anaplasma sp.]
MTLLSLTIAIIISGNATHWVGQADFKKFPFQISSFFPLDATLTASLILLLLAFYVASQKATSRREEAQQPVHQPVRQLVRHSRFESRDYSTTQDAQPKNSTDETYRPLKDALSALGIRTGSATNHPSPGQVVVTVDHIPQFDIRTLQKAGAALRGQRVAFYVDEHLRILCIIGNNAFRVKACSDNCSKPTTTRHMQIVLQPGFPQGMQILERRVYFRHDGSKDTTLMYPVKAELTPENLILIMLEPCISQGGIGGNFEAFRHYLEFYSQLLSYDRRRGFASSLEPKSGGAMQPGEAMDSQINHAPVHDVAELRLRLNADLTKHSQKFSELLRSTFITRSEKRLLSLLLDEAKATDALHMGTSLEFLSALYVMTCAHKQFFQDLDEIRQKRVMVGEFLINANLRTAMITRTLGMVYHALLRVKNNQLKISLESMLAEGKFHRTLPYFCGQMPALVESIFSVLLISYGEHLIDMDLDPSIMRWLRMIPGSHRRASGPLRCVELCASLPERWGSTQCIRTEDIRFLAVAEVVFVLSTEGCVSNDSVQEITDKVLEVLRADDKAKYVEALETTLSKLNEEDLRQVVASAVAYEVAKFVPAGKSCSMSLLEQALAPEVHSNAVLKVLEGACSSPSRIFTSLMSEVAYVHYPSTEEELAQVNLPTGRTDGAEPCLTDINSTNLPTMHSRHI